MKSRVMKVGMIVASDEEEKTNITVTGANLPLKATIFVHQPRTTIELPQRRLLIASTRLNVLVLPLGKRALSIVLV